MLIVAERINSSRKKISEAIQAKDADFIRGEAKAQAEAGADYIDVNAGSFVGQEAEYLCWLVEIVQEATELPLCLDSPDPAALAAALELVKGPCMLNSITLEKQRLAGMLPLVKKYRTKIIALCQSDEGMANTVEEKVSVAKELIETLTKEGVALDDIYIDPLIYPIATDTKSAVAALGAIREIMQLFPGVHTIAGLTNVSFGLPVRKLINRTFLVAAMAHGLDSAIIDPTDRELMASLVAAEVVLDRDKFCAGYITAYREGKLA
ncbi:MAG TPA: dihydropteroate synthase [Dehalococcoidia bacterium]|jgi:5-methyltetrahydrofolate--homocysteine methyltransferase|nr:dihydropteroate synthase [Dehalococcoidia bacterium]